MYVYVRVLLSTNVHVGGGRGIILTQMFEIDPH